MKTILYIVLLTILGFTGKSYGRASNGTDSVTVKELARFMQRNLHYPTIDRENDVTGRVFISFTVENDAITGTRIGEIKKLRDSTTACGNEVVRVLRNYKGTLRLKPGDYSFSVDFALSDGDTKFVNKSGRLLERDKPKNFLTDITIVSYQKTIRKIDIIN